MQNGLQLQQELASEACRGAGDAWGAAREQLACGLLSVIMPAYRLGDYIADNISHVHDLFSGQIPFEIIPVDDGSNDHMRLEMERISRDLVCIHPVYLENNTGKGAALRAGFRAASGSHILLLDGDLDLPPSQVAGFFDIMEREAADVVIGAKRHPGSILNYPLHRKILSTLYLVFVKLLIGLPVSETQPGIKLFKRPVLEWIIPRMLVKRYAFARRFPATSRRGSYIIPSLFVLGLLGGAVLAPFSPLCRILYVGVLALYAAITLLSSFSPKPHVWVLTWVGIVLTHVVYGSRFLMGFAACRMPSTVSRFDHASESTL